MADGMSIELIGLDELLREMRMLPESIRTRVLKGAVATGASVVRKEAVRLAPLWTGSDSELMGMVGRRAKKLPAGHPPAGTLKRSIYQTRMTQLCNDTQEVWKVDVSRGKDKRHLGSVSSSAGPTQGTNKDAFYALWVEYGHYTRTPSKKKVQGKRSERQKIGRAFGGVRWVPAQPYMRPAFTSKQSEAIKAMGDYIDNHLKDAVSLMRYVRALA